MDNLDLLSNDDLRVRLQQYGFPNIPITQTTRKTLIKKLRLHLDTQSKNLKKSTTNATKYSSGEDSDNTDGSNNNFMAKGGRRTGRMTVSGVPTVTSTEMGPPRALTTPRLSNFSRSSINTISSVPPPASKTRGKASIYVSPVIINDSEDDDLDLSLRKSLSPSKSIFTNRSSTTTSFYTNDHSLRNGENEENEDDDDQNSTSEYTKRLLQLRCDTASQKQPLATMRKRIYLGQQPEDIVYHADPPETTQTPLNAAISQFMHRLDENYGFKQTLVPCVLLSFLIIFFLLIIFMYVTISPNLENTLNPLTAVYKKCDQFSEVDTTWSCVDERQLESSLNLLKVLGQELQRLAISSKCDRNPTDSSIMCIEDVLTHFTEHQPTGGQLATYNVNTQSIMQDIHSAEYLLAMNPQWGMQNVDEDGQELTLRQLAEKRATNCFVVSKPKLPLSCIIYNKLETSFMIIGTIGICAIALYAVRQLVKLVLIAREKRKELVNRLINEIITALLEKMMLDKDNPILVLNHLREKLIDPQKRSEMEWAWVEAIKYLENNDSRIQFEVKNMNGEDFKVIRWIDENKSFSGSSSPNSSRSSQQLQQESSPAMNGRSTKKFWMGPAFDKTNKIKDPPTQCLKIRQMFDKFEANDPGLKQVIQDSILNKLEKKNCRIFDIQLDVKTCCVYVKCASNVDAGILHDEINGWWFDNNLVSIKFLRQERYIQRFPNSTNASTVLKPSKVDYSNGDEDDYDDDD